MLFGMVALLRKFVTLVGSVVVILIRLSLHREPGDQQGAPEFATYVSRCVSKKFGSKVTYGKSEGHFFVIVSDFLIHILEQNYRKPLTQAYPL